MPINSPTGFLDITNATLRTSNLEAENLLINGGNIYVSTDLESNIVLNLENVTNKGNITSNTIRFTNATTGIIATGNIHALKFIGSGAGLTSIPSSAISGTLSQWSDGANSDVYIASNVGIGNVHTLTSNTLQVGGNLYVRDTDANVLTVNGNVVASYFEGDGSKLSGIVTDLQGVTDNGNVTTNVVQFSNVTTGLVTTANIEVGGDIKVVGLTVGTVPYVASDKFLKDSFITMTGDATVITSNLDVTGNIFMRGKKFIVESETKLIKDAIIGIANNNASSTTDKGIIIQNDPSNANGNIAIIHHGAGSGFADQLTFGYTADPLDTVTVTNDLTKELTVNVLGNVITQNNLSIGGLLKINTISAASSHSLQAVTNLGNVTSNTVQFSNAITSLVASSNIVATGNVSAGHDTNTTSYFGRAAVGYMGTNDHASFAHVSHNDPARYALKQTAAGPTFINTPGPSGHIRFTVNDGDVGAEKMRITGAGNVGIGVSAPHANLHVAGNVYVSSNLTVGGNVSDLNVVSNVNMLHTANTAAIKLNSNVVTEFPRSKKLIKYPRVALNSASQDSYVVTSSTDAYDNAYFHRYDPFRPFVSGSANGWHSGPPHTSTANSWDVTFDPSGYNKTLTSYGSGGYAGTSIAGIESEWLKLELPHKIVLSHFFYQQRDGASVNYHQSPRDFRILGSNDDVDWDTIKTFTGQSSRPEGQTLTAEATKGYKYLAFVVTATHSISSSHLSLKNLEYYGTPEYDPDAHGTDVTIKSVPNVPNTDFLEIYYDGQDYSTMPVTVTDKSGNNRNGTPTGGVVFDTGYKAFTFDGTNDSISTTSTATLSNHTASMWIKFEKFSGWEAAYAIRPASIDRNNAFLYANADGRFRLEAIGGSNSPYKDFTYDFEFGKWVHLTVLFDATGLRDSKIYIDNVELRPNGTERSITDDITITGTTTVYIGSEPGYFFNGSVANFRLFNRKLSTDEIYQLYAYQKEDFGHSTNNMTLKAGRLGIGTSEPRAALDVRGRIMREYNPGEVIEELHSVCNTTSLRGRAVIQNVTGVQNLSTSYADATGSRVEDYIIPKGTNNIVYEYTFHMKFDNSHAITHWRLYYQVNGGGWEEVTNARMNVSSQYYDHKKIARWVFEVDADSESVPYGKLTAKAGDSIDFRWYIRDYGTSHGMTLHSTQYWDGGQSDTYSQPLIMIKAIA